jgi:hypothetical protein
MSGRLVFPDIPHQRPAYSPWLDPLCKLTNGLIYGLIRSASGWTHFEWEPALATRLQDERCRSRPMLMMAWHRFNYVLAGALMHLAPEERPTLLMHDGLASRALTHESSVWAGFEVFAYRRRSAVPPRTQIIDYVRSSHRPLLLLPDAGGPYGKAKPGIVEIARATGACVLPLSAQVDKAWVLGSTLNHLVPKPGARIRITVGEPLDGATLRVEDCQAALEHLEAQ